MKYIYTVVFTMREQGKIICSGSYGGATRCLLTSHKSAVRLACLIAHSAGFGNLKMSAFRDTERNEVCRSHCLEYSTKENSRGSEIELFIYRIERGNSYE